MEFNFSAGRLLLLIALLAIFAAAGGFSPPSVAADSMLDPHRASKAWRHCVLLFISGAVSASLIDHFVGTLDRSNLRLVYIVIGVALMILAFILMNGLPRTPSPKATNASHPTEQTSLFFVHAPPRQPAIPSPHSPLPPGWHSPCVLRKT